MKNFDEKQTIKELHDEYTKKSHLEQSAFLQERYKILSDLYSWVNCHSECTPFTLPVSKSELSKLQKFCKYLLNLLLKKK